MGKRLKEELDGDVAVKTKRKVKRPPRFKVMIMNDDYTPMDFVTMILMQVFNKSNMEAVKIMLTVHTNGRGLAGIYTREVAETKIRNVTTLAKGNGYPLRCLLERE